MAWRSDPKRELWFAWWSTVVFYQIFGLVFFVLTRTQPPPPPSWDAARIVGWFTDHHHGLLIGLAVMFLITGMVAPANALIAYSMRRMSISPAFGYAYLVMYALSAVPGMLLLCIALVLSLELLNSAIESLANAVDPSHNHDIGKALDIASGAVLTASLDAAVVGTIIFLPRLVALLGG